MDRDIPVKVIKWLLIRRTLNTEELTRLCGCDRKSIYRSIAVLECAGFSIDIAQKKGALNVYTLNDKIYGGDI